MSPSNMRTDVIESAQRIKNDTRGDIWRDNEFAEYKHRVDDCTWAYKEYQKLRGRVRFKSNATEQKKKAAQKRARVARKINRRKRK